MEVLKIEWCGKSKGSMELVLDNFFPCDVQSANKVFDLAVKWCSEETISELKEYFSQKSAYFEEMATDEGIKKEYSRIMQSIRENEERLKTNKHPNGVFLYISERIQIKKQIESDYRTLKSTEKIVKNAQTMVVKYDRMLRILNCRSGRK